MSRDQQALVDGGELVAAAEPPPPPVDAQTDALDAAAESVASCVADAIEGARSALPDSSPDGEATDAVPGDPATPNVCRYDDGHFEITPDGIRFVPDAPKGVQPKSQWICSRLRVTAKTRDARSGAWGRLLEWEDDDRVAHHWVMPLELLEGDGIDLRRELARLGLRISPARSVRDLLPAYIKVWPVRARALCVERLGWHGSAYTTSLRTFGATAERVVFQNQHAIEPALASSGSVAQWRRSVARLAAGNSRLVFAIATAFAAPLADLAGEDSGGFHLRGPSSSGKSTALWAAASVWGPPDTYVRQWRATTNGLEGLAALHNDGLLVLDELGQCDPLQVGEAAYLLANGRGKARANRLGTACGIQRWRLLVLSAGEESLAGMMARTGQRTHAGQEIRLADIDADAGAGLGLLERLHEHDSGTALIRAIHEAAARWHGAVGLQWLEWVTSERRRLTDVLVQDIDRFVARAVAAGGTGQAQRVARRFALVAAAGELATRQGLTGWSPGECERAALACFASWQASFGTGNREERGMLAQVRAFFEKHGASRFEAMEATGAQRMANRAGFVRRNRGGSQEYLVLPEVFRREICEGYDDKAVAKLLLRRRWIVPGGDGRVTQKPRVAALGATVRVVVFGGLMWSDEGV